MYRNVLGVVYTERGAIQSSGFYKGGKKAITGITGFTCVAFAGVNAKTTKH